MNAPAISARRGGLSIADGFSLPIESVTLAQAILAQRGAGKSYAASVMAEEMLCAGHQIVAIDPTGAWWGLRASADGKAAGLPIAVLGGERGDVPLDQHAGETVARAIVEERFSAVLDLSLFRKGEVTRFMTAFLETIYRLNRDPIHIFIDEADVVAPQKVRPDTAQLLGAAEDVVRRGRRRGIGCTLITQRPQVLSKDVLTQCEILTTLRLGHPKDIAAVREWVEVHASAAEAKVMMDSLPSLATGTAWVWSPVLGIFERVHVRRRTTFDSGATPKPGQVVKAPKVLAQVDVAKLGKAIAETAQRAKDNDPRALKAEVEKLRRQVAALEAAPVKAERVEVPILDDEDRGLMNRLEMRLIDVEKKFGNASYAKFLAGRQVAVPAHHSVVVHFALREKLPHCLSHVQGTGLAGSQRGICQPPFLACISRILWHCFAPESYLRSESTRGHQEVARKDDLGAKGVKGMDDYLRAMWRRNMSKPGLSRRNSAIVRREVPIWRQGYQSLGRLVGAIAARWPGSASRQFELQGICRQ